MLLMANYIRHAVFCLDAQACVYSLCCHGTAKKFGYFNSIETGSRKAIENFLDNHKDVFEMWGTKKSDCLNQLQQEALKQGMENKFQLIQGPPGAFVCSAIWY